MPDKVYSGKERKLLISFHLGSTCARACYSILNPGSRIHVEEVQRFRATGGSTAPCVVYYDSRGKIRAIAKDEYNGNEGVAGEEELLRVPVDWSTSTNDCHNSPPLPHGKYPMDILSDFLRYLNDEVQTYIRDAQTSIGSAGLDSTTVHYTFIGPSQSSEAIIRVAAQKNGMIENEQDNIHMTFLTEGEAYFEACLNEDCKVLTCEEGGACIVNIDHDILTFSSFRYKGVPRQIEAITESQSDVKGYSAVNEEARKRLPALSVRSRYTVPTLLEIFDHSIKPFFCRSDLDKIIYFTPTNLTVQPVKVNKFWLRGYTVALFFEPLVRSIIEGVLNQVRVARKTICIVLTGIGASSDYIFQDVKKRLGTELPHIQVLRSLDQPGSGQVQRGGIARAIRLHELISNVSEKAVKEHLLTEPVSFTSTDVPDNSPPEFVDEAKRALEILENIVDAQRSRESQILALREENEKLKKQAEASQKEYLELEEKNTRLIIQLKELEDWRERVMVVVGVIQEKKTHETIKTEYPMPTVAEETGSSNE